MRKFYAYLITSANFHALNEKLDYIHEFASKVPSDKTKMLWHKRSETFKLQFHGTLKNLIGFGKTSPLASRAIRHRITKAILSLATKASQRPLCPHPRPKATWSTQVPQTTLGKCVIPWFKGEP